MMSSYPNSTVNNNNEEKPYAVVNCLDGSLHVHEGLYYLLLKNVTKNDPFTDKEIRVSNIMILKCIVYMILCIHLHSLIYCLLIRMICIIYHNN